MPKKTKWEEFAEKDDQPEEQPAGEAAESEAEGPAEQPKETEAGIEFPSREKLEDQLTAMEMKMADYKNECLRAKAEMDNVRRRAERDVEKAHKFGAEKLLKDCLPVMDSLLRGLEGDVPEDARAKAIFEGMELTLGLMQKMLEKHGVEMISPEKGEAFNPEMHEAMSMQPDPEAESNTVLTCVQAGYALNGRVLRAAMVVVAQ